MSNTMHWIPSEVPYIYVDYSGDSSISCSSSFGSAMSFSHDSNPRDYETERCINDYEYFETALFDKFNKKIRIDPERNLDDYRELRVKLIDQMKNILRNFLDRGIIKNFSIYRVFREINYITVEFGVLKNNEWLKIEKSFRDESKNYGFR